MDNDGERWLKEAAREKCGGDPVLEEVLFLHLRYNWGKGIDPWKPRIDPFHEINGIKFWRVGHNASHEFYTGTDGSGKRFRYSIGESVTVDMDGNPLVYDEEGWPTECPGYDTDFEEVSEFNGYYGHF